MRGLALAARQIASTRAPLYPFSANSAIAARKRLSGVVSPLGCDWPGGRARGMFPLDITARSGFGSKTLRGGDGVPRERRRRGGAGIGRDRVAMASHR